MRNKILYLLVCYALFACQDKKMTETRRTIKEWVGKTICIPELAPSYLQKNADTLVSINDCEYKILNYMDSTGCTGCRLRMDVWKLYIEEMGASVNFLFYFQSKEKKRILSLLRKEQFENYPIYIDTDDKLVQLNNFSSNPAFQCFLLDKNNRVLAIGNPVHNIRIWELYKKIIRGK